MATLCRILAKKSNYSAGFRTDAVEMMVSDFAPRVSATYNSFLDSDRASRIIA